MPDNTHLTVHKMSPYNTGSQAKQSAQLAIHPSHPFQQYKINLTFPQQYMTETLVITYLQHYCTGHKTQHQNSKYTKRRSNLLTLFISLSVATKRLNPPECKGHGLPIWKQTLTANGQRWVRISAGSPYTYCHTWNKNRAGCGSVWVCSNS